MTPHEAQIEESRKVIDYAKRAIENGRPGLEEMLGAVARDAATIKNIHKAMLDSGPATMTQADYMAMLSGLAFAFMAGSAKNAADQIEAEEANIRRLQSELN